MTDTTKTSAIEQALTAHWGERCLDTEPGCPCCDAWAEYDALQAQLAEARNAALEEFGKAADELGHHCIGCGHLCGDPDKDLANIRKHGGRSCCPEREIEPLSSAIASLVKSEPAPRQSVKEAAQVLLGAYDGFMAGKPETELVKAVSSAACFGAAAYEKGIGGQGVHALARSFLIALIDPADKQLDYLRSDPSSGKAAREAVSALRALRALAQEKDQ